MLSSSIAVKTISYQDKNFDTELAELNRIPLPDPKVEQTVRNIIQDVRQRGDEALVEISNKFSPQQLTTKEITLKPRGRVKQPSKEVVSAIKASIKNVESFHKHRVPKGWQGRNTEGAKVGEVFAPFDRVGVYVPGGTAPLISTAIMTVTLAKVAGVKEIVVATPAPVSEDMRYAIKACGATEIYQVGGAQAIAAMAYGTETIKRAQKVFGPGNAFVVEAKRQVFGVVAVDLIPGPSEIAVLADKTCQPAFVAADLLAQAEHGPGSQIYLVSPEQKALDAILSELDEQMKERARQDYLLETLNQGCSVVRVRNIKQGIQVVEGIAPEHASLACKDAAKIAKSIRNCGAVFIGDFSPVAAGDYAAGPSHALPTGGAGKSFPGLTIEQFVRRTSIVEYSRASLKKGAKTVETLAMAEGLDAHANSVSIRFTPAKKRLKSKPSPSL